MLLSESSVDKEIQDDALYELAHCQTEIQAWDEAKNSWKSLLKRFPDSHFVGEAKLQLAQLVGALQAVMRQPFIERHAAQCSNHALLIIARPIVHRAYARRNHQQSIIDVLPEQLGFET